MEKPNKQRESHEMSPDRWARLAELAGKHGCKSWRVLVRKLADGELAIGGAASPAKPVTVWAPPVPDPMGPLPPKPVPVSAKPIPAPYVMPGQRDLSHRRDGAVPVLKGKG
jgi:hypothetical protein